jgi:hypothetical protein
VASSRQILSLCALELDIKNTEKLKNHEMSPPKEIRRGNLQRASSAAAARNLEGLVFIITIIYPIVISNPSVEFHVNF